MRGFEIQPLLREKWQGHELEFFYITNHYYDVRIVNNNGNCTVSFLKTPFVETLEKRFADKLFQPWWDDAEAWGVFEGNRLSAAIETSAENWSNRLRVTELWVDEGCRRKGYGSALMDIAKKRAGNEKRRAIILETQSCNENAVAFYLSQGFSIVGFDACAYTNGDIERKEVRIEMGFLLGEAGS